MIGSQVIAGFNCEERGRIPSTRQQQLFSSFIAGFGTRHSILGAFTASAAWFIPTAIRRDSMKKSLQKNKKIL
jgi:hypothetical protein